MSTRRKRIGMPSTASISAPTGQTPLYYDLTVNTGYMGIEGAIAAIKAAFAVWKDLHYKEDSATHEK